MSMCMKLHHVHTSNMCNAMNITNVVQTGTLSSRLGIRHSVGFARALVLSTCVHNTKQIECKVKVSECYRVR